MAFRGKWNRDYVSCFKSAVNLLVGQIHDIDL